MDERLQKLRRAKAREYRKHKKSPKYIELQKKFMEVKFKNSKKYMKEKVELLRHSKPSQFFKNLKVLGARPGEAVKKTFILPSHSDAGLSPEESAELATPEAQVGD